MAQGDKAMHIQMDVHPVIDRQLYEYLESVPLRRRADAIRKMADRYFMMMPLVEAINRNQGMGGLNTGDDRQGSPSAQERPRRKESKRQSTAPSGSAPLPDNQPQNTGPGTVEKPLDRLSMEAAEAAIPPHLIMMGGPKS